MFEIEWKEPRRNGILVLSAAGHGGLVAALVGIPLLGLPELPDAPHKLGVFQPATPLSLVDEAERPKAAREHGTRRRVGGATTSRSARTVTQPTAIVPLAPPGSEPQVDTGGGPEEPDPVEIGGGEGPRADPRDGEGGGRDGGEIRSIGLPGLDAPVPVFTPEPLYPEPARRARVQGVVLLEAVIAADGRVESVRVVRSASVLLDQAAIDAVRRWMYEPARIDGRNVPVYLNVTLTFRLNAL